jgi:hypothetical protein
MDWDAAVEVHQVEQLQDLLVAGLQAPWPPPVTEMCGDNAMKLKQRRQNRVNDSVLIVGFVLGVGVENDSDSIRGFRDKEWVHIFCFY